jgi:phosphoglycerate dehydrogenase-like enzyme
MTGFKVALHTENNALYQKLLMQQNLPDLQLCKDASQATIVLAAPPLLAPKLGQYPNVEWVQSTYAGIDALTADGLNKDYQLTNVKGIFGQQIAEYVLGYSIAHYRHFALYREQQTNRDWQPHRYQSLSSKTMVIFGTGSIGQHLAKSAKAMNIRAIGVNRTGIPAKACEFTDVFHINEAARAVKQADIIVNTLPNTAQTANLFDATLFSNCQGALFFNVGRGQSVDSTALLAALEVGQLEHAFLDVFINEPISQECPYWHHPQVTVTPHVAAISFPEQVIEIFTENYLRWRDGFQLQNRIDFDKGY